MTTLSSTSSSTNLTKYPAGSIRELWAIAWPMILSSASSCLMVFGDRLVLSFYSQEAFDASVGSMSWYWAFLFVFFSIVMITQVFVGRFNGEGNFSRIGSVVWQMVWLSFGFWFFIIPVVIWGTPYLLAQKLESLGVPYLRIMLLFLPICCAATALGCFFSGRGNTKVVFRVTLFANVLNILLAVWFVFGGWFVPRMGICGAGLATGLAQVVSFLVFFFLFYRQSNQKKYSVFCKKLDWPLMLSCIKTGLPNSIATFLNFGGWAILPQVLAVHVSHEEFTAFGIAHSIYVAVFFMIEGIGIGVGAICANVIGAKQYDVVGKNLRSAFKLHFCFSAIALYLMVISPSGLIRLLLPPDACNVISNLTTHMLVWTWLLFVVEGIWFIFQFMLTSAGDTKFTCTWDGKKPSPSGEDFSKC